MAALYAQGLAWERMHDVVREYAGAMGSVRHLLSDLTLPIISVFSGAGFDRVIRESFKCGAQRIEDLWLRWVSLMEILTVHPSCLIPAVVQRDHLCCSWTV